MLEWKVYSEPSEGRIEVKLDLIPLDRENLKQDGSLKDMFVWRTSNDPPETCGSMHTYRVYVDRNFKVSPETTTYSKDSFWIDDQLSVEKREWFGSTQKEMNRYFGSMNRPLEPCFIYSYTTDFLNPIITLQRHIETVREQVETSMEAKKKEKRENKEKAEAKAANKKK